MGVSEVYGKVHLVLYVQMVLAVARHVIHISAVLVRLVGRSCRVLYTIGGKSQT